MNNDEVVNAGMEVHERINVYGLKTDDKLYENEKNNKNKLKTNRKQKNELCGKKKQGRTLNFKFINAFQAEM